MTGKKVLALGIVIGKKNMKGVVIGRGEKLQIQTKTVILKSTKRNIDIKARIVEVNIVIVILHLKIENVNIRKKARRISLEVIQESEGIKRRRKRSTHQIRILIGNHVEGNTRNLADDKKFF